MPSVVRVIHDKFGTGPSRYRRLDETPQDIRDDAVRKIMALVFGKGERGHVVPRFHTIRNERRNVFFEYDSEKIVLRPEALVFLHNHGAPLLKMVLLEWVRFLENANSNMPKIIPKIEDAETGPRNPTRAQKNMLYKYPESRSCFYCGLDIKDRRVHYDHFIPWSFMYGTDVWNLVVSCPDCNRSKSDMLASRQYVEKLLRRNETYPEPVEQLGKDWKGEIERLYEACKEYGFEDWAVARTPEQTRLA